MKLSSVSFLALSLLGGACSDGTDSRTGERDSLDDGEPTLTEGDAGFDFDAFDATMNEFIAEHSLRGAGAAILHESGGIVHHAAYGEFSPDRGYLIMSSSKIVSVGVLMRLSDEGLVDLDAPIGTYLQDWGEGKPELTIAQLVSGSHGLVSLDRFPYEPYACQYDASTTLEACGRAIYTADDAVDRIEPETEFHYGGAAWQLAGAVAEVVSGKSWAELVEETYAPCGVSSLVYSNGNLATVVTQDDGSVLLTYPEFVDGDASPLPVTENPGLEAGAFTTVEDYAKLLLMHLRGGLCGDTRVLSTRAVERMQEDHIIDYGGSTEEQLRGFVPTADPEALNFALDYAGYGLGWWIDREQPGRVIDPGAFGALAALDNSRDYGVFVAVEADMVLGLELAAAVTPVLRRVMEGTAD